MMKKDMNDLDDKQFIFGWHSIAKYCKRSVPTVIRWHQTRARLPFHKDCEAKAGRIFVEKPVLNMWLKLVKEGQK